MHMHIRRTVFQEAWSGSTPEAPLDPHCAIVRRRPHGSASAAPMPCGTQHTQHRALTGGQVRTSAQGGRARAMRARPWTRSGCACSSSTRWSPRLPAWGRPRAVQAPPRQGAPLCRPCRARLRLPACGRPGRLRRPSLRWLPHSRRRLRRACRRPTFGSSWAAAR